MPDGFREALARERIALPAGGIASLAAYLEMVLEANRSFNLTAVREPAEAWERLILESIAAARFLTAGESAVDIGSGAGLPGIPLAIAMPGCRLTLVEATGKKAGFLEAAARRLGLGNVTVLNVRAEEAGRRPGLRGAFDTALARAVGELAELVELALPLLRVGGRLLAVKGRGAAGETELACRAMELLGGELAGISPLLPATGGESVVVEVRKSAETPEKYPRRAGMPHKRPL